MKGHTRETAFRPDAENIQQFSPPFQHSKREVSSRHTPFGHGRRSHDNSRAL